MYFNQDEKVLKKYAGLLHDLKLTSPKDSPVVSLARIEQIGIDQFDAIYIPGGHAPMQDLLKINSLVKFLTLFIMQESLQPWFVMGLLL